MDPLELSDEEKFQAEVRAEKARLRYQYAGYKSMYAKIELWWTKHFNRQAYPVAAQAWKEIEAEDA